MRFTSFFLSPDVGDVSAAGALTGGMLTSTRSTYDIIPFPIACRRCTCAFAANIAAAGAKAVDGAVTSEVRIDSGLICGLVVGVDGHESGEQMGIKAMSACGLDASADAAQMRRLNAAALVRAVPMDLSLPDPMKLQHLFLFCGPIVDGQTIPDEPMNIFAAGREHPVPMIVGNTRNEMALFLLGSRLPADEAEYLKQFQANFGNLALDLSAAYPVHDASQVRRAVIQMTTDLHFALTSRAIARAHSAAGHPTFRYQFSRGTHRALLELLGAHHGSEVLYLFQRPMSAKADDLRISRTLGRYWINFAASGNPNAEGLPTWTAYQRRSEQMIDIAQDVMELNGYRNAELDLMEKVSSK